jgi:hypothetical protein
MNPNKLTTVELLEQGAKSAKYCKQYSLAKALVARAECLRLAAKEHGDPANTTNETDEAVAQAIADLNAGE